MNRMKPAQSQIMGERVPVAGPLGALNSAHDDPASLTSSSAEPRAIGSDERLRCAPFCPPSQLASSSVIRALLAADEIDRLSITLDPELVGGGARLFEDGLPATFWKLTDSTPTESGALCLIYDRVRS